MNHYPNLTGSSPSSSSSSQRVSPSSSVRVDMFDQEFNEIQQQNQCQNSRNNNNNNNINNDSQTGLFDHVLQVVAVIVLLLGLSFLFGRYAFPTTQPSNDNNGDGGLPVNPGNDAAEFTSFNITKRLWAKVRKDKWRLKVFDRNQNNKIIYDDKGGVGYGTWIGFDLEIWEGYVAPIGTFISHFHATHVTNVTQSKGSNIPTFTLATHGHVTLIPEDGKSMTVSFEPINSKQFVMHALVNGIEKPETGLKNTIVKLSFHAEDGEGFFGFGERYNAANQRGNHLYCWTEEGGWSIGGFEKKKDKWRFPKGKTSTYIPMPYFVSNRGYALELNTTYYSRWDVAASDNDRVQLFVDHKAVAANFYVGDTPREAFQLFTAQNDRRSLIPPKWAFGPWSQLSGEFKDFNITALRNPYEAALKFVEMDIPVSHSVHTVHFLPARSQLGRQKELTRQNKKMHSLGLKQTAYFNAYVLDTIPLYDKAASNGYFVQKSQDDSSPYKFDYFGTKLFKVSEVDFTNPDAKSWYQGLLKKATDIGFDGWMYDYGEYTSVQSKFYNGKIGKEMHNEYPLIYQQTAFEFFKQLDNDPNDAYAPDYVFYVRSGYTGSQKYTWAQWTGDPSSDWSEAAGLPAQIPASLSLGLSGMPFSGSDIGGFTWLIQMKPPSPELWCRWAELGAFSGLMHDQAGGLGLVNKTHILDSKEGVKCWRRSSKLRTALFPYTYTAAHQGHYEGLPIMRHHVLDFPHDAQAISQEYQYMFGDSFLVSPVIHKGARKKTLYLPSGEKWIDVSSPLQYDESDGRFRIGYSPVIKGGVNVTVDAGLYTTPLFVRAGSIISTIDPSVLTLNSATNDTIVTLPKRSQLLHLWIFPNETGDASNHKLWDGASFSWKQDKTLRVSDPKHSRTMIVQVAIDTGKFGIKNMDVIGDGCGPYKQVSSWKELAYVQHKKGVCGQWAFDKEQKVLWMRVPSVKDSVVYLKRHR
eukprot:gb/GECH01013137.1/.p1 GENE.gb/GECH01013137.1/~~gb/GECH01013137.1/.p1  ORF type:complete len:973 (+),score=244.72 gb/GECH01013137.1/:1-2919(+)